MKATSDQLIKTFHSVTGDRTFRTTVKHEPEDEFTSVEGTIAFSGHMIDGHISEWHGITSIDLTIHLPKPVKLTQEVMKTYGENCDFMLGLLTVNCETNGDIWLGRLRTTCPLVPGVEQFFDDRCQTMIRAAEAIAGKVAND